MALFVSTLRDVNRLCSVLSFAYASVKEEVDFIDMAGICSLKVFAYSVHEWIRTNKTSLVGGHSGGGIPINDISKNRENLIQQFTDIFSVNPELMLNAVASLFPRLSNAVTFASDFATSKELNQAMRIAAEKRFDLYFSLSLNHVKIARKELEDSLFFMDENTLRLYNKELTSRGFFSEYLLELSDNLSRVPEDRIELILSVITFKSGRIIREKDELVEANSEIISIYTVSELLFGITDEIIRYTMIKNMFYNTDFLSFQYILYLLHIIELSHGRIVEKPDSNSKRLVSLEHLIDLENIFLLRVKNLILTTNLLDWKEARRASMLWEIIEVESYSEYIKPQLGTILNAVKFISLHVSTWFAGGELCRYEFSDNSFEKYVSSSEMIDKINEARLSKVSCCHYIRLFLDRQGR